MPEDCQHCGNVTDTRILGEPFCNWDCAKAHCDACEKVKYQAARDEAMREDYYQERREWLREINEAARVAGEDEVK